MNVFTTAISWVAKGATDLALHSLLIDFCNALLASFSSFTSAIGPSLATVVPFAQMFGGSVGGGTSLYSIITTINKVTILPIANAILALVMVIEFLKTAQRMDGNSSMPGIKEIIFLIIFFTIYSFLINNSIGLCEAVYSQFASISKSITSYIGTLSATSARTISVNTNMATGTLLVTAFMCMFMWFIGVIGFFGALILSYVRALEIYIFSVFAPIPLALLGLDETRQIGVGFIKAFVAKCLATSILVLILCIFPFVVSGAISISSKISNLIPNVGILSAAQTGVAGDYSSFLITVLCVALLFAMFKSGSIADRIMGS